MHWSYGLLLVCVVAGAAFANDLDDAVEQYRYIQGERHDAVYVAKFYNPPSNLMNATMVAELSDLLGQVEADEQTRVLIFTGGVPDYFIQHYDVGELDQTATALQSDPDMFPGPELHATHQAYLQIEALSKPVIAAINGQAHGGGFELTLACDFRIMTNPGSVGLPEANVGILPGAGGTVRLPRLIGAAKAKEFMMQGMVADADTAERIGMVMKAVPPDELMDEAMALANRLASLPPLSLALIKKVVNESADLPLKEALRLEEESFWELMKSEDAQRLMRQYVEANQGGLE
jgi:enoyl-CoA hydratase